MGIIPNFRFLIILIIFGFCTQAHSMDVEKQLSYSINLMWLNESLSQDQEFLCKEKCVDPAIEWAKKSDPYTPIYFWYDSKHTTKNALENTKKLIQENIKALHEPHAKIKFMDVRNVPLVMANGNAFSDKLSVYFRSDLLRVIAGDYLAQNDRSKRYIVYSDLNIPPLSKEELFDEDTTKKLNEYGLVLAKNSTFDDNGKNYENAFYILDSHNIDMIRAIKLALIDTNIDRANYVFQHGYSTHADYSYIWSPDGLKKDRPEIMDRILALDEIKEPEARVAKREEIIKNAGIRINKTLCETQFTQIIWITYPNVFKLYAFFTMHGEINDSHVNKNGHEKLYEISKAQFCAMDKTVDKQHCEHIYGKESPMDKVKYFKLAEYQTKSERSRENKTYIILQEIDKPSSSSVSVETTEKRKGLYHKSGDLFDILSADFKYPFLSWNQSKFFSDPIPKIVVESYFFNIPTKDVKKPVSSFYTTKKQKTGQC